MDRARSYSFLSGSLNTLHTLGSAGTLCDSHLLDVFLDRRDPAASDAAFRVLVERHGSMVLSVCRQRTGDLDDAQDAFQATFLVLVRRARSIRNQEALGGWLFVTARRVAERARMTASRRREVEHSRELRHKANEELATTDKVDLDASWSALHDEIERLPWLFRDPLVLHYFEGLTAEAIAQRLGCPRGTVLSRLARARSRLKNRLEQKGVALSAVITPSGLAPRFESPFLLPSLVESTTRCAGRFLLSDTGYGLVPAQVRALASGASRTLMLASVRQTFLVSTLAFLVIGLGLELVATMAREQDSPPRAAVQNSVPVDQRPRSKAEIAPQLPVSGRTVEIRGRVVDPTGQMVPGARIVLDSKFVSTNGEEFGNPTERAISGPDGRFSFSLSRAEIDALRKVGQGVNAAVFAAVAPGRGTAWADLPPPNTPVHDVELKLTPDDIPIIGRLLDQQGHPVANVRATVFSILEQPNVGAPEFLRRARSSDRQIQAKAWDDLRSCLVLGLYDRAPSALTDASGEFRLTGVGRNRIVLLDLLGSSVAVTQVLVMTTSESLQEPVFLDEGRSNKLRLHGPRFELRLPPGRELAGMIRDEETGEPLPGIRLISPIDKGASASLVISDARGRYSLKGQPFSASKSITLDPQSQPYFPSNRSVAIPPGTGPVPLDLTLARGVFVEGRVTDRVTGRPVRAKVGYWPFLDNPVFKVNIPGRTKSEFISTGGTDVEGHFRLVALPGPGLLAVLCEERGYLTAMPPTVELVSQIADKVVFERDFGSFSKEYRRIDIPGTVKTITAYTRSRTLKALTQDFALEPGHTVRIRVDGPDGKPLTSASSLRGDCVSVIEKPGEAPMFHYIHENPGKSETLVFLDQSAKLGGVISVDGSEKQALHLTLRPTGTVSGRLVDEHGKPRSHVLLEVWIQGKRLNGPWEFDGPETVLTGADGTFVISGVIPELVYRVDVPRSNLRAPGRDKEGYLKATRWSLKPGEVVSWGDVRVIGFNR